MIYSSRIPGLCPLDNEKSNRNTLRPKCTTRTTCGDTAQSLRSQPMMTRERCTSICMPAPLNSMHGAAIILMAYHHSFHRYDGSLEQAGGTWWAVIYADVTPLRKEYLDHALILERCRKCAERARDTCRWMDTRLERKDLALAEWLEYILPWSSLLWYAYSILVYDYEW